MIVKKLANFGLCVSNQPVILSAVRRCVCTAFFQSTLCCGIWKVRIFPVSFSVQSFHGDTLIILICCGLYYTVWCAVSKTLHWNMLLPSWELKAGPWQWPCFIHPPRTVPLARISHYHFPPSRVRENHALEWETPYSRPTTSDLKMDSAFFSQASTTQPTFIRCSKHRTGLVLHCMKVLCSIWLCQL